MEINHQPVNKSVSISLWIVAFSTLEWIWYFFFYLPLSSPSMTFMISTVHRNQCPGAVNTSSDVSWPERASFDDAKWHHLRTGMSHSLSRGLNSDEILGNLCFRGTNRELILKCDILKSRGKTWKKTYQKIPLWSLIDWNRNRGFPKGSFACCLSASLKGTLCRRLLNQRASKKAARKITAKNMYRVRPFEIWMSS